MIAKQTDVEAHKVRVQPEKQATENTASRKRAINKKSNL
jgi:hypothetical protein